MVQRVSQRASSSRTNPRNPRTFKTLENWTDFLPGARQRFSELDDTKRRFQAKVVANEVKLEDGTLAYGQAVGSEECLKANLNQHVLQCVTQVAKARGKDVEFIGTGSGRQLSNTDLLIRKCGVTNRNALSSLVLGIVEIKGNWQLKLGPEDDLIEALNHPTKTKWVASVIQQAFGDAITDEAPLIIISNYEVTYFLLRDTEDANNRTLKVSPPVAWNIQDPPAMACFLHALELSAELWDAGVKAKLSRDAVLGTPVGGFSLQSGEFTIVLNKNFQHGVAIQGPRHSSAPRHPQPLQQRQHCPQQQQQQQGLEQQQQQQQEGLHVQGQQLARMVLQSRQQQQQHMVHQQPEQQAWEQKASEHQKRQEQQQQQLTPLRVKSSQTPIGSTAPERAAALAQEVDPSRGSSTDGSSSDGDSHTGSVHSLAASSSSSAGSSVYEHDWQDPAWQEWADEAQQAESVVTSVMAVDDLPFLLPPQLRYTDRGISSSSTSTVVQGYLNDTAIALKIYKKTTHAMRMFLAESAAYIKLVDLQGKSIMPLAALGRLPHSGACVLGLYLGQPVPHPLPAGLAESAKAALGNLHKAGYSHGDISGGNMLLYHDRVLFCDLQTCQKLAKKRKQSSFYEDVTELRDLLAGDDAVDEALVRH